MPKNIVSATVNDGLIKTIKEQGGERWMINPKAFRLTAVSAIPITQFKLPLAKDKTLTADPNDEVAAKKFGIAPMGITDVASTMTIRIKRIFAKDSKEVNVNDQFSFVLEEKEAGTIKTLSPIKKSLPAAMWGNHFGPDLNGERMVDDLCTGLVITPAAQPTPGHSKKIDKKNLIYAAPDPLIVPHLANQQDVILMDELNVGQVGQDAIATINKNIMETAVMQARNRLLESMGIDNPLNDIHLGVNPASDLIISKPKRKRHDRKLKPAARIFQ
ncbi:MAG: hypothetical protein GY805_17770 [Chloroflexi bacterium]|nr:hypothetical protein [Chloroflexota bacterium]